MSITKSLGMLFDLSVGDCFVFNNKSFPYCIVAKEKGFVHYQRIIWNKRGSHDPVKESQLISIKKVYCIIYTETRNVEVFDFLPF